MIAGEVDIDKTVDYETLEAALVEAAEEVGWKARVQDKFKENYKLNPVEKTQDYDYTMIKLRGRLFSAMKVYIPNKNPSDRFYVWTGLPFGIASEKEVQKYLSAVSKNL